MPLTPLSRDEVDIKVLRAAVKKIRNCAMPHEISEDAWTGRSADNIKGLVYSDRHTFDLVANAQSAYRWLNPKKDDAFTRSMLKRVEDQSFFPGIRMRLRLAKMSLLRMERNLPGAQVNGNIMHWSEHAMHVALWSPVVAESVALFLESEADAREQGVTSPSSAAAVKMAKEIKKKKVWDNTIETVAPKKTLVDEIMYQIPSCRVEAIRRLTYMEENGVDRTIARALFKSYGTFSVPRARKDAQRMLRRAERAVLLPSVKAADKKVWNARVQGCQVFLDSLDA